jgi:hypothetical protein
MSKPRCAHCPVDPSRPCRRDAFPWFCKFAATGHPVRLAAVVGRNAIHEGKGPESESFPPLMEQAANLAGAAVRFVASGGKTTTPEEQARRLGICRACEHFDGRRCRLCACVARWKARLSSEHCPDKPPRW